MGWFCGYSSVFIPSVSQTSIHTSWHLLQKLQPKWTCQIHLSEGRVGLASVGRKAVCSLLCPGGHSVSTYVSYGGFSLAKVIGIWYDTWTLAILIMISQSVQAGKRATRVAISVEHWCGLFLIRDFILKNTNRKQKEEMISACQCWSLVALLQYFLLSSNFSLW